MNSLSLIATMLPDAISYGGSLSVDQSFNSAHAGINNILIADCVAVGKSYKPYSNDTREHYENTLCNCSGRDVCLVDGL